MKSVKLIGKFFLAAVLLLSFAACEKDRDLPDNSKFTGKTDPEGPETPGGTDFTIADAPYKIVAHRGGSSECGAPDNCRASLRYAMQLKCCGSECDIYWTKDNNVVIAHADGECKINGYHPWEATLEQIRKGGVLKNGETVPCLEDFLDIVMVEGNCTKLVLDIKNITSPSTLTDYPIKAVQRACEIIKAHGAEPWCEFICTGNTTVARSAAACQASYGIPVGWMGNQTPAVHKSYGFTWANMNTANYMTPYGKGDKTIDSFVAAGVELSVFNVDMKAGDGNAVYSDEAVAYYVSQYSKLKFICTNYPSWLINKVK
ncbi:MAG: glycerophosphodiester phosphodiesterase [Bacteroidales bacterium]|nr:glycerophosphodiester phosphodiesterase [Bacteroidales bacterium]